MKKPVYLHESCIHQNVCRTLRNRLGIEKFLWVTSPLEVKDKPIRSDLLTKWVIAPQGIE